MTLPSSGAISIQHLRNEYYAGAGPTDLAHYGGLIFGTGNVSLAHFYGLSAASQYRYGPYAKPGYPPDYDSGPVAIATAHGVVNTRIVVNQPGSLNERYYIDYTVNPLGWAKFLYVETPGGVIAKAGFVDAEGGYMYAWPATSGAGNAFWVFST